MTSSKSPKQFDPERDRRVIRMCLDIIRDDTTFDPGGMGITRGIHAEKAVEIIKELKK